MGIWKSNFPSFIVFQTAAPHGPLLEYQPVGPKQISPLSLHRWGVPLASCNGIVCVIYSGYGPRHHCQGHVSGVSKIQKANFAVLLVLFFASFFAASLSGPLCLNMLCCALTPCCYIYNSHFLLLCLSSRVHVHGFLFCPCLAQHRRVGTQPELRDYFCLPVGLLFSGLSLDLKNP